MLFLYGFALLAGLATAVAPGQNASLAKSLAHPILAGTISVAISCLTVAVIMLATGWSSLPSMQQVMQTPWWAWLGGVCSAFIAIAQLYVSKRIGAAPFLGIIVTAGVVTSIVLDNFGLVGFKVHDANVWRIVGGALMILGVGFVAAF